MKYQLSSFNKNYLTRRIACDIHKMFDETKFLDIEMKCNDGEILKAHKAILASRSTVFYAIFSNCPKQPHNQTIEILDFDSTVMKEVLRFIYCTDIENLEKISRRLIFAAEKFQLEGLKKICIENIVANLSSKNVIRCLRLADRITKADRLFDECLETAIR